MACTQEEDGAGNGGMDLETALLDHLPAPGFSFMENDEPFSAGIDEAGRGPVLGSLVYGIFIARHSDWDELRKLNAKDSKMLTPGDREEVVLEIAKLRANNKFFWLTHATPAEELSAKMLAPVALRKNLNQISQESAVDLLRKALAAGLPISALYVDALGAENSVYEQRLRELFPQIATIAVRVKADALFPPVSAASIFAKVRRDAILNSLTARKVGDGLDDTVDELGSGYPGDPKTKQFLQGAQDPIFAFPPFVRHSWQTAKKVLDEPRAPHFLQCRWEADAEESVRPVRRTDRVLHRRKDRVLHRLVAFGGVARF